MGTKRALRTVVNNPGLENPGDRDAASAELFLTRDFQQGVRAFLEKRRPLFDGT